MLQKLRGNNQEGFTLIELMIVIAIIGILAAIAIPNFIAYRDKSYCSAAETDAGNVAAALADYFAIPSHTQVPNDGTSVTSYEGIAMTNDNSVTVTDNNDGTITIAVVDGSGRCPDDYQNALDNWSGGTFTRTMD